MAYHYYIVESGFPGRINDKPPYDAAVLLKDGTWNPTDDSADICTNGREVTRAEALAF